MKTGREAKPHIGIYGRCNAGKSSLLNFITGSDVAIVSPHGGTTTDVVRKSYEILGFAPVIFIDTAGVDDTSPLGVKRVAKTLDTLTQIDLGIIIFRSWGREEELLRERLEGLGIPYILVGNMAQGEVPEGTIPINVVGEDAAARDALLAEIQRLLPESSYKTPSMFEGLAGEGDIVLLVCPIDSEAPAGRLILPQVQAMRELLDRNAIGVVVQPAQVQAYMNDGPVPVLVVTDSQVFSEIRKIVPDDIEVTSFSILLAAAKGDMKLYKQGLEKVETLRDGDRVLVSESCSHQVSCEDIGRVKIPHWLEAYTGKRLNFEFTAGGGSLPADLEDFALMIQCGGCMVTRTQLQRRIQKAAAADVAVTNYGMLIKKIRG